MQQNPLFPSNQPTNDSTKDAQPAVDMIRQKLDALYAGEPDTATEVEEAEHHTHPGSKHQAYMRGLNESGMTLVEIQAAWHEYYAALPDAEKHAVWQEFYVQNNTGQAQPMPAAQPNQPQANTSPHHTVSPTQQQPTEDVEQPRVIEAAHLPAAVPAAMPVTAQTRTRQKQRASQALQHAAKRVKGTVNTDTAKDVKKRILHNVKTAVKGDGTRPKLKAKHHIQSLAFGLGIGAAVVFVVLFSFFNERIIAPLIQPSRNVNDTPVIVDVANTVVAGDPKVIIPKINVEIPVDYSMTTTNEQEIELALDKGVVHYPTTSRPGQTGNAAFFGHSSNNIFNPGKYKFAFVLLHTLQEGDVFYLSDGGKTYAYKVFSKRIVKPTEVGVLKPVEGHASTATLITCDPPGTSINRLIVVGDQISPDANGNAVPTEPTTQTASTTTTQSDNLPGNGPGLWSRIWGSVF